MKNRETQIEMPAVVGEQKSQGIEIVAIKRLESADESVKKTVTVIATVASAQKHMVEVH